MSKPFSVPCLAGILAFPAYARRRGGGGSEMPWLSEAVLYTLLGLAVLAVVLAIAGFLLRNVGRRSAAELARERSMKRQARAQSGLKR